MQISVLLFKIDTQSGTTYLTNLCFYRYGKLRRMPNGLQNDVREAGQYLVVESRNFKQPQHLVVESRNFKQPQIISPFISHVLQELSSTSSLSFCLSVSSKHPPESEKYNYCTKLLALPPAFSVIVCHKNGTYQSIPQNVTYFLNDP